MQKGICVAGNLILDKIYLIEQYPGKNELTTILEEAKYSPGGAVCNVAMDLARMDDQLNIRAVGLVGNDEEGDYILDKLKQFENLDLSGISRQGATSATLVMTEEKTKYRTFFQYRGANALLQEAHFDWDTLDVELLHIGYILLLDALDREDAYYGTAMARLLANAKRRGIKTSIDVVSEAGSRFEKLVPPALRYTDFCVINEIETQEATGIPLRDAAGSLLRNNMEKALLALFDMGVGEWAVVHAPEGGFGMDKDGCYVEQKCLKLPEGYIKGTVGAGDAFCSGILYAAYKGQTLQEALRLGVCTAAASLSQDGATDGVLPVEHLLELYEQYNADR